MNTTGMLRSTLADAAGDAPSDLGLLDAVYARSRRRHCRHRTALAGAAALILAAVITTIVAVHPTGPLPGTHRPHPLASMTVPLVPFQPPTFPYRISGVSGAYQVDYDSGVSLFGVDGTAFWYDELPPQWPDRPLVFLSGDRPAISGASTATALAGRAATYVTDAPMKTRPNGDEASGTALFWRTDSGSWLTMAFTAHLSITTMLAKAARLEHKPVPLTTTFVPGVAPAGTHVTTTDPYELIMANDDQSVKIDVVAPAHGTVGFTYGTQDGTPVTTYTWAWPGNDDNDLLKVTVYSARPINIPDFAAHLTYYPTEEAPLPKD
jgi:hypothetical protein